MKTFIAILATFMLLAGVMALSGSNLCTSAALAKGCTSCTGETPGASDACNRCAAGHFLNSDADPSCGLCSTGKGRPADAMDQTGPTTCNSKISLTSPCNVHGASDNSCVTCKPGYHLSATSVCSMCPTGRGKDLDTTVPSVTVAGQENTVCSVACNPTRGCRFCGSNQEVCIECLDGRYLDSDGTCVQCTTGCSACIDSGLNQCSKCSDNFYYSAQNTCKACPTGKFRTAPTAPLTNPESEDVCTVPAPTNPGPGTTMNTSNTTGNVTGNNSNSTNNSSSSKATTIFQVIFGAIIGTLALQ